MGVALRVRVWWYREYFNWGGGVRLGIARCHHTRTRTACRDDTPGITLMHQSARVAPRRGSHNLGTTITQSPRPCNHSHTNVTHTHPHPSPQHAPTMRHPSSHPSITPSHPHIPPTPLPHTHTHTPLHYPLPPPTPHTHPHHPAPTPIHPSPAHHPPSAHVLPVP